MKHNILVLTASVFGAAMLLGSCQERLGGEGNIGFTADVASYKGYNVGSKAAPIGDPLNEPDTYVPLFQTTYGAAGFNVKAYKGTTLRLDGTSKFTNGDWTLDQTAKWYSGENLDFYAIAPVNNRGITGVNVDPATKKMSFTYQVQTNKGISQPDIMVGYYSGPGVESTTAGKRIAPLTFYHPLAAVRFKAGDIDGAA
ncbi:MAG: fimbrillin family protein, partial [Bacteroidales bacterium]|nr:fimbrillin family protein [Bacteroidales bacterium]